MQVVRKQFKFPSSSLDYVSKRLLGRGKAETGGFDLWLGVMKDDPVAWKKMERYQRTDVLRTDQLYTKLLPWIDNHPSVPLHEGFKSGCPTCGSARAERRGYAYTAVSRFIQYHCLSCGSWYRGSVRLDMAEARAVK